MCRRCGIRYEKLFQHIKTAFMRKFIKKWKTLYKTMKKSLTTRRFIISIRWQGKVCTLNVCGIRSAFTNSSLLTSVIMPPCHSEHYYYFRSFSEFETHCSFCSLYSIRMKIVNIKSIITPRFENSKVWSHNIFA